MPAIFAALAGRAARGLTKEEFDALPPGQHDAMAKEMAEDLKKSGPQKRC